MAYFPNIFALFKPAPPPPPPVVAPVPLPKTIPQTAVEKVAVKLLSEELSTNTQSLIDKTIRETQQSPEEQMAVFSALQRSVLKTAMTITSPLNTLSCEKKLKSKLFIAGGETLFTKALDGFMIGQIMIETPLLGLETYFIFYKKAIIKSAKAELQKKEKELEVLTKQLQPPKREIMIAFAEKSREVRLLKKWIEDNEKALVSEIEKVCYVSLIIAPESIRSLAKALDLVTNPLTKTLSIAGPVAFLLAAGYKYQKAFRAATQHDQWIAKNKDQNNDVKALLEKRKELDKTRADNAKIPFQQILSKIRSLDPKTNFDAVKAMLKKEGIYLENISSLDELLKELNSNESQLEESMFKKYTEHRQTVSALTKNGLKAMFDSKNKLEKGFYDLKLKLRTSALGLTFILSALSITFAINSSLIPGAIGAALLLISTTGIGALVVAGTVMLVSLAYLIIKKRNYLWTYVNALQARTTIKEIPLLVQVSRLKKQQFKLLETMRAIEGFNAQLKKLESIEHLQKNHWIKQIQEKKAKCELEKDKISAKIALLEKSIKDRETSLKPLKEQISEAGWKDYLKLNRLDQKTASIIASYKDIIAQEPATLEFMQKKMGVTLQNVEKDLKKFFGMDDEEMSSFIKGRG